MQGLSFFSKLDLGYYIVSVHEVAHYLYKTLHGVLLSCLGWFSQLLLSNMLDKLQNWLCWTVNSSLAACHLLNSWLFIEMYPASIFSIAITLIDVHLNWLNWLPFLILVGGSLLIQINFLSGNLF